VRFLGFGPLAVALMLASGTTSSALAQSVSAADLQRLQDAIYDASRDVTQARDRDAQLASQLQGELDDLRDETVYLRVKLRKHEPVTRNEYSDLRDRIDAVRTRARGENANRYSPATGSGTSNTDRSPQSTRSGSARTGSGSSSEVPVGTEFDVRLQDSLSSGTAQVEDRFEATTMVELREGDRLLVPAGSVMRGIVSSVTKAGRVERKGSMTVAFDQITIDGRTYPVRATVTQAIESEGVRGEAGKIGAGAGVGAIIGGILGGFKGALAGILIGGGGTIAATEGKDVDLPAGTVLRVRLDSGLNLDR
jgi:TolA-binding protein